MSAEHEATAVGWWPWLVLPATASSLVAVGLTLALVDRDDTWLQGEAWVNVPLAVGFSTVAAGIWSSRPAHAGVRRLAVLYTVVGLGSALVIPAFGWARLDLPGAVAMAWVSNWIWTLGAAPLLGLGLVLYPDGRLPGPRWRPAVILGLLAPLALLAKMALSPGPLENHPGVDNPVGVLAAGFWDAIGTIAFVSLMAAAFLGLAALAVKFRSAGADSDVRGQIGGFAVAGVAVVLVSAFGSHEAGAVGALVSLTLGAVLPLTVGVAVVRHRLLDQRAGVEELHRQVDTLSASRRDLVTEREDERARLRRELHDGLGPSLAAIGLGLRQLERSESESGTIRVLADEVQRAVSEVRRICEGLRPAVLDELGLAKALVESLRALERFGPHMVVEVDDVPPLAPAVEVAAFRIVMEAATNAVRHSGAERVRVRLRYDAGLRLLVCDDGRGMSAQASRGVGLGAMADRAEEIGGSLVVGPAAGSGTCVEAWLPEMPHD